jgi:hypothetical protein
MKKWYLIYETKMGERKRPIWPDELAGIFRTVIVSDIPTMRGGRDITIRGTRKTEDGFAVDLSTIRVASSAKHLRTERQDVGD